MYAKLYSFDVRILTDLIIDFKIKIDKFAKGFMYKSRSGGKYEGSFQRIAG